MAPCDKSLFMIDFMVEWILLEGMGLIDLLMSKTLRRRTDGHKYGYHRKGN